MMKKNFLLQKTNIKTMLNKKQRILKQKNMYIKNKNKLLDISKTLKTYKKIIKRTHFCFSTFKRT